MFFLKSEDKDSDFFKRDSNYQEGKKVKKESTHFYNFMTIAFIDSDCLYKIGFYVGFSFSAKEESEKG